MARHLAINHDLLRTFVEAGSAATFAAAAARRRISPSAVSQQIATLESQLGVALFERLGRRARLTETGRALLAALAGRLSEIDELLDAAKEARHVVRGTVRIGAPGPFARVWLRPRLVELHEAYPGLVLEARFNVPSVLAKGLKAGEFDFCVLANPPDDPGFETAPLFVEQFIAVASPAHVQKQGRPRSASEFRAHPFIVFDDDLAMHAPWWRSGFGRREPLPPNIVAKVASLDEMLALATAGVGIAVLPNYFVRSSLAAGAVVGLSGPRAGGGQARNQILLAWRKAAARTQRFVATQALLLAKRADDLKGPLLGQL